MKGCEECGKKLGILNGYRHPTKGKNHLLCSSCFDILHESVVKWREANLPYVGFFNKKTPEPIKIPKISRTDGKILLNTNCG